MDRNRARRAAGSEFPPCRRHRALACAPDRERRTVADDTDAVLEPDHWAGTDFLPRLAVGPRPQRSTTSSGYLDCLRHPRAGRATSASETRGAAMTGAFDPDFAPIEKRIRESVGQQGFMVHVGAELWELARGTCRPRVD